MSVLALAERFTKLRRSGRQWVGCCPLHQEDTPSFYVNEEKQVWSCHGCGRSGGYRALAAALLGEAGLSGPLPPARPRPPKPRPELTPWGAFAPSAEMAVRDLLATAPPWHNDRTYEAEIWARSDPDLSTPINGWSRGDRTCQCSECGDYFPGGKGSVRCWPCADRTAEAVAWAAGLRQ